MKKLYVGNLPYSYTAADLEAMFADYGEVESSIIITDRASHRSKGFGFVEISDDDMADKAIEDINGTDIDGRNVVVNIARPRVER